MVLLKCLASSHSHWKGKDSEPGGFQISSCLSLDINQPENLKSEEEKNTKTLELSSGEERESRVHKHVLEVAFHSPLCSVSRILQLLPAVEGSQTTETVELIH